MHGTSRGYLFDVRVLELANELGEYAGKLFAGLGADVLKIEPPGGNSTREIGPFLGNERGPDRSIHFWHYNIGKKATTVDLPDPKDQSRFLELLNNTDIFLDTTAAGYLATLGISYASAKKTNPGLIWSRITPFGDTGPWSNYKGSDLVHLALGGIMMNTGYDPDVLSGKYDTPPIAPQIFQSYHIAGQLSVVAAIGALLYRHETGRGQFLSTAVHEAVSKNTEVDVPAWIYQRQPLMRQTCRHAGPTLTPRTIALSKDGRHIMARGQEPMPAIGERIIALLDKYGAAADLTHEKYKDPAYRNRPEVASHITDVIHRFIIQCKFEGPWREAQEAGINWVPLRRPEENLNDAHWTTRETFQEINHPELGHKVTYVRAPWSDATIPWGKATRAPLANENTGDFPKRTPGERQLVVRQASAGVVRKNPIGTPFALNNVRIIDFTWWLASGGGPRFLSSLGAEVIKVEWKGRWDLRFSNQSPDGGRTARDQSTNPIGPTLPATAATGSPNRSGTFNNINSGKRGISLNMNHPKGKSLLTQLIKTADVVAEGFSPEVMRKWGFGYEQMREINPSIIYVQQSGMGQKGTYGKYRATGPTAASLSGISEMSGLAEPFPPAGIGYSYLDWFGAYNIATALMSSIYHREKTGLGTYIDASQVQCGIFLTGSTIPNFSANGQRWQRYGNRSPWKLAAPAGAYQCLGDDRWIAVTCSTQEEWEAFCQVLGKPIWNEDTRFTSLQTRLEHQDELDQLINAHLSGLDAYNLMHSLQESGVPAGVCQTAEDRIDHDPQLKHLNWLTEVTHSEIGQWPVIEFPVHLSETPAYMGGAISRGGPCYGEDNNYVYQDLLGLSQSEVTALREEDVI
ncbi:CoA transferase [Dehalococcoidia bacterium]|nr:CoA transferase [Dehalococcoidia bacterium]